MNVSGKTVLVAGGAGSLGSVIANDLIVRGARVAIFDVRQAQIGGALFVEADVSEEEAVAAGLQHVIAELGKISALVNCTGLIHSEPIVDLMAARRRHGMDSWHSVIRSNLTAAFVLTSAVAEHMAMSRTKGVIINFSSIAASGNPGQAAYAAAKAGVEALTIVSARELGPFGIRAVAIAPGFVDTPSTHAAVTDAMVSDLKRRTPLRRLARPEEIAAAVAFAMENDFVTGQTIAVDGGLTL